jgi:hypothetical protein
MHGFAQPRIRAGNGGEVIAFPLRPGRDVTAVEPQPRRHPHRHSTAEAFGDAHHVSGLTPAAA